MPALCHPPLHVDIDNQKIEPESQSGRGGGSQFSANLDSSDVFKGREVISTPQGKKVQLGSAVR